VTSRFVLPNLTFLIKLPFYKVSGQNYYFTKATACVLQLWYQQQTEFFKTAADILQKCADTVFVRQITPPLLVSRFVKN
jgi:hypothetical protein